MKSFRIIIFSQVLHRNVTVIKISGNILLVLREGSNPNLNNSKQEWRRVWSHDWPYENIARWIEVQVLL